MVVNRQNMSKFGVQSFQTAATRAFTEMSGALSRHPTHPPASPASLKHSKSGRGVSPPTIEESSLTSQIKGWISQLPQLTHHCRLWCQLGFKAQVQLVRLRKTKHQLASRDVGDRTLHSSLQWERFRGGSPVHLVPEEAIIFWDYTIRITQILWASKPSSTLATIPLIIPKSFYMTKLIIIGCQMFLEKCCSRFGIYMYQPQAKMGIAQNLRTCSMAFLKINGYSNKWNLSGKPSQNSQKIDGFPENDPPMAAEQPQGPGPTSR